jgi:hypothetical protein
VTINHPQSRSVLSQYLFRAIRFAFYTAALLSLANSLFAEDHLYYSFANPAKSAETEGGVTITLDVSARDDGSYSATYSHRDWILQTLSDVKTVTFERSHVLTSAEGRAFFASLVDAGVWKLPKGDNFIGDAPNLQLYATISGRELQLNYNSPIEGSARKTLHATVTAFAKKLGIDRPEDAAKATQIVEGDRTPARAIRYSSLITNPARYDGKRIAVAGNYHREFECSMLTPQKFDWRGLDSDEDFWVDGPSKFAKKSAVRWKNDSWVWIEGVFSARHGGHLGVSPGVIYRVTKFTALEGPPPPAATDAAAKDDPHGLENLTLEIQIQPFPMDGRPIQEVVAALNRQIGDQLAQRGLAEDWLRIELDPSSDPKARVDMHPEKPEPLRSIIGMLGLRISPGEENPFGQDLSTYTYVLPNVIRLFKKTSVYPDDKEPLSFHEDTFGKQAVHAKLTRYAGEWRGRPETFRVEWHSDINPAELRVSEALGLIHRILPDEPGAKSIADIRVTRAGAAWNWSAHTNAAHETASSASGVARIESDAGSLYLSPWSFLGKRRFVASLDAKTVRAAPEWNFIGEPPLEFEAAIRAAREALREIPNVKTQFELEDIVLEPLAGTTFSPLDASRCDYKITFRDQTPGAGGFLIIPVLLSGKAIAPKEELDSKGNQ